MNKVRNLRCENRQLNAQMLSVDFDVADTYIECENLKTAILEAEKAQDQAAKAYASLLSVHCHNLLLAIARTRTSRPE